ncbi:MAG: adenine phosphoribosyltransferase [Deltaproteobacteria bacterium]|nr:adenine phosphoribosyltransferase [Deltaproteobacteria bacterium]
MDPRLEQVRNAIRDIPDFPKPGILFRDITPLLADPAALRQTITLLEERYRPQNLQAIVAVESRGFVFGAPLALHLDLPLHLVRKAGKLPGETESISYDLEYGSATLEIHKGALPKGARALIIDDLLATGGTARAACQLVEKQGGQVVECAFIIELEGLNGREKLGYPTHAMLTL